jgi:hypothetical protein
MAQGAQYSGSVTVTSSGQMMAFGINAFQILVANDGSSSAFLNITTTSGASTSDFEIKTGESLALTAVQGHYTGLSLVTTTGSTTAPCRILATR